MPPSPFDRAKAIADLQQALGYKPLNRTWAKLEIVLGLAMAGIALCNPDAPLRVTLIALGGYLAMAGHRSHLYQSNNELTAYLVAEIRRLGEGKVS